MLYNIGRIELDTPSSNIYSRYTMSVDANSKIKIQAVCC